MLTAYPVFLFSAAAAGVVVQLHLRQRPTAATLAVVGGLVGYGALWLVWNLAFLTTTLLASGAGMNLMFSALALLLGWGAARWAPARDTSARHDRLCEALLRQIPLAMVAFTSAAVGFIALGDGVRAGRAPAAAACCARWCLLCAIVRQTQQLRDRDSLLAAERAVAEGQAKLQHLAHHDPLTGLPNRMLLRDRVTQALATAARRQAKVALMFIDLDQFKEVNDTLGHATGDALLCHVAGRVHADAARGGHRLPPGRRRVRHRADRRRLGGRRGAGGRARDGAVESPRGHRRPRAADVDVGGHRDVPARTARTSRA